MSEFFDVNGVFIVYDVTDRQSFDGRIEDHLLSLKNLIPPDCQIMLIGNKIDLIPVNGRAVTFTDADKIASLNGRNFRPIQSQELICVLYSQLLVYRTLGYTGIRTYQTPRISVPRRKGHSMFCTIGLEFGYIGFLIYRRLKILVPTAVRYKGPSIYYVISRGEGGGTPK